MSSSVKCTVCGSLSTPCNCQVISWPPPQHDSKLLGGVDLPPVHAQPQLTKREHFAAMAMQGILSTGTNAVNNPTHTAKKSVDHADALQAGQEPS